MWSHHLEPKCLRFKYISQQVSQLNVSHPLRQAGKLWGPQDGLAVSYMHEKQDIHPRTIWGSLRKRGLILGRDVSSITSIAYLKLCTIMGHFSCICESQQQRKPDLQGRDRLAKVGKSGSLERGKSYNHRVSGEQYVQGSVDKSCPTLCNPMDYIAHQAPLSKEFPSQEYCCGLPFPSLGIFSNQGWKPWSHEWAGGFFTTETPGKPREWYRATQCVSVGVTLVFYIHTCVA